MEEVETPQQPQVDTWEPPVKELYNFKTPVTKDLKLRPVYGKPGKPTLDFLMYMLRYHPTLVKKYVPVGTEFPSSDYLYDNPWIVVHYKEQEYFKDEIPHYGMTAILMHKYVSNNTWIAADWSNNAAYDGSGYRARVNDTYFPRFISTPFQEASCQTWITLNNAFTTVIQRKLRCFVPSITEVNGPTSLSSPLDTPQGELWEYFEKSNPINVADATRVAYWAQGVTSKAAWMLRNSGGSTNYHAYVGGDGNFGTSYNTNTGIGLRACITVAPDTSTPNTFNDLYEAMIAQDTLYYPVGRSIVDDNDPGNPWRIAHYSPVRLANGEIWDGVWMVKHYALDGLTPFSADNVSDYRTSDLRRRFQSEIWENIPEDVQSLIAETEVQYWDGEKYDNFTDKVRPLSATEFLGIGHVYEGEAFEIWRVLTGTQKPNGAAMTSRIVTSEDGVARNNWTYSYYNTDHVWGEQQTGEISQFTAGLAQLQSSYPTFFIPAHKSKQIPAETFFEDLDKLEEEELREKYPIGSEVTDNNDIGNPWLVMHYGEATDAESKTRQGVYLRKKAHIDQRRFSAGGFGYQNSEIPAFLNSYLNLRPEEWKERITPIAVPYFNNSATTTMNSSLWIMSLTEMNCVPTREEGFTFDYYKEIREIEEPIAQNVADKRICETMSNSPTPVRYWTRSGRNTSSVWYVTADGAVTAGSGPTAEDLGVLPACFVAKKTEEEITEE